MKHIQKYYSYIGRLSRTRGAWVVLLILVLLFNFVILPLLVPSKQEKLLDTRLHYTSRDVSQYLATLNSTRKTRSLIFHTTVDILYPVIYTLFLSVLFYLTGSRHRKLFVLMPLTIFIFDLLENSGIVFLVAVSQTGGALYKSVITVTPLFTTAKWVCTGITVITLLFMVIKKGISSFILK